MPTKFSIKAAIKWNIKSETEPPPLITAAAFFPYRNFITMTIRKSTPIKLFVRQSEALRRR